ncbi:hypothetical protein QL996_09285 [Planococcus sp. APC 4015]|nr:hypothetical protein [Planococcus sp. APC 4015]
MNLPKQLISLIGVVLVLAIAGGGAALIVLPAWNGAQTTDASARAVAQTNDIYAIDVQRLTAAEDDFAGTESTLASLRSEIAEIPRLDDVYEIVVAAAADTGTEVTGFTAADPEPWVRRGAVTAAPTADAPVAEAAPVEEPVAAEPNTTEVTGDPSTTDQEPVETEEVTSPQQQVSVTLEVTAADAATAAAFMDALGRGPRLLALIDSTYDDGVLTVIALALIRTEE